MKYIYSVAAALFALIFAVNTHASCLGSPAAMKELCESGGGALEVTKAPMSAVGETPGKITSCASTARNA